MNSTTRNSANTAALPLANLGNCFFFFGFRSFFPSVALLLGKLREEPKCHPLLKSFLCSTLSPVSSEASVPFKFRGMLGCEHENNKACPKGGRIRTCQRQAALGNSNIYENCGHRATLPEVACSIAPGDSSECEKDGNVHTGLVTLPPTSIVTKVKAEDDSQSTAKLSVCSVHALYYMERNL